MRPFADMDPLQVQLFCRNDEGDPLVHEFMDLAGEEARRVQVRLDANIKAAPAPDRDLCANPTVLKRFSQISTPAVDKLVNNHPLTAGNACNDGQFIKMPIREAIFSLIKIKDLRSLAGFWRSDAPHLEKYFYVHKWRERDLAQRIL